jgi:hypothetical protein
VPANIEPNKDLVYIDELFEAGKLVPVIDRPYKLADVPQALRLFGTGDHEGSEIDSLRVPGRARTPRKSLSTPAAFPRWIKDVILALLERAGRSHGLENPPPGRTPADQNPYPLGMPRRKGDTPWLS